MRRTILAIGSALALTVAGLSSPVMAQRHMHFGGHYGFRHFGGPGFAVRLGAPYYAYGSACYSAQRVWTPFGWRWHRVWVC
jgi:hypothetical protein